MAQETAITEPQGWAIEILERRTGRVLVVYKDETARGQITVETPEELDLWLTILPKLNKEL